MCNKKGNVNYNEADYSYSTLPFCVFLSHLLHIAVRYFHIFKGKRIERDRKIISTGVVCFVLQVMRTWPSSCCRMEQGSPPTCSWTIQPSVNACSDSDLRKSPVWMENRSARQKNTGMFLMGMKHQQLLPPVSVGGWCLLE